MGIMADAEHTPAVSDNHDVDPALASWAAVGGPTLWAQPVVGAIQIARRRPRLWLIILSPLLIMIAFDMAVFRLAPGFTAYSVVEGTRALLAFAVGLCTPTAFMFAVARDAVGCPVDGPRAAYGRVKEVLWRLIGQSCLIGCLIYAVLSLLWLGAMVWLVATKGRALPEAFAQETSSLMVWTGFIALAALWGPLSRLAFSIHGVVLGGRGPVQALAFSWRLTRGRVLDIAPYVVLTYLPLVMYVVVYRSLSLSFSARPPWYLTAAGALLGLVWGTFTTPLWVLLWYRFRAETQQLSLDQAIAESAPERQATAPAPVGDLNGA
jgi:hypothetical protein